VRFLVISQELSLKKKTFFLFYCNLYISLNITTDFLKVLYYFENLEFQENLETKRSTTSIKMQGDLYPREVVVSVLTDSSVNNFRGEVVTSRGKSW
jgi:hypothetical protein